MIQRCHASCRRVDWNQFIVFGEFAPIPSRLMQACGLKPPMRIISSFLLTVTPHAGVWIETNRVLYPGISVTGHASCRRVDWNDYCFYYCFFVLMSRLMQACGLKRLVEYASNNKPWSRLMQACGLKPCFKNISPLVFLSRLMQACGLKLNYHIASL